MNKQPNGGIEPPFINVPEGFQYLTPVEHVLGVPLLPEEIRATFTHAAKPEGLSWEGTTVWQGAYVAGLRAIAVARATERHYAAQFEDYQPRIFNKQWHDAYLAQPSDSLAQVVQLYGDALQQQTVRRAARNVMLANNVTHPDELPSTAWADRDGPRANLQQYFGNVLRWFAQSPPRATELTPSGRQSALTNAVTLVAPTGVGKTMVGGDYLAAARVGEVMPNGHRRRAVWITTSQALIRDCLDPEKTLQRCLADEVKTTAIWEHGKDAEAASGDVVCVTMQSLEDGITDGLITPDDFDVMIFDEAHHALTPRMLDQLQKFDCQKILMTATPSRNERRSLLHNYHYVKPMGRREAVEKDLLSPVRLLAFQADSNAHAEHLAALSAVQLFIRQGKKAVIYCQPGGDNAQARRVAELVNGMCRESLGEIYDDETSYAEMVGSARVDSAASVRRFEQQTYGGVRTTCQMLGEGWDYAELDGVIFVGPQGDLVALEQESGRALRPKVDGREAILIEVLTPIEDDARTVTRYCLAQTFGLETVPGADFVFGHHRPFKRAGDDGPQPNDRDRAGSEDEEGQPGQQPPHIDPIELPEALALAQVSAGTSISEIIIAPERRGIYVPPPEFSVTASSIARDNGLPITYVHYHFEARKEWPAVPYKLIRRLPLGEQADEEAPPYDRYYHAEALAARLEEQPLPLVSADQIYSRSMMARMFHAPENMIDDAIAALGFSPRPATRTMTHVELRGTKPAIRYTVEEMSQIADWIERVPEAGPDETTFARLVEQYPFALNFVSRTERTIKRHPAGSDRKGSDYFVTPEVVARVEAEHTKRTAGDLLTLNEVAAMAGLPVQIIKRALNEDEVAAAQANRFTPPGGTRHAAHLPRAMAEAVAERVKARPLQPHEVTYAALAARINAPTHELRRFVQPHASQDMRRLPGSNYPVRVYPLRLLAEAEVKYGLREAHAGRSIDYSRIPEGPDLSPEQAAFARRVQIDVLGFSEEVLAPPPAVAPNMPVFEPVPVPDPAPAAPNFSLVLPPPVFEVSVEAPVSEPATPDAAPSAYDWVTRTAALETLKCTGPALDRLLKEFARPEHHRVDEDGVSAVRADKLQQFVAHCRSRAKVGMTPEMWRTHAALIKFSGATDEELQEYLRTNPPRPQEWRLVRGTVLHPDVDVAYNPAYANQAFRYLKQLASGR